MSILDQIKRSWVRFKANIYHNNIYREVYGWPCPITTLLCFFGPNWLVTATNRFLLVIFGPVRLFWVWERRLTGLGLGLG